jgi:membrane-associated phospholipid phosphatase
MRVAFLLAVLLAAGLSGLLERYWRPLACRLGKGYRLLRPALSLLSLGMFAKIASEVHEEETSSLDRAVSLAFRRLDSPVMDVIMRLFTALGSFPAIAAVVALVALWRILRSDKRGAVMLIAVAGATELLNLLLKEAFQRARPSLFTEGATLHSYSFPSGHAMASAAVYGAVAVLMGRAEPAHARRYHLGAAVLVLLIGMSRVYLGVHWFTDVLAGFAAGLFVLLAGTNILRATGRTGEGEPK